MHNLLPVGLHGRNTWQAPLESQCEVVNRALVANIRVIHRESRETHGSPSIWDALIKRGYDVDEHRVARLMLQKGLRAKPVTKWRATT